MSTLNKNSTIRITAHQRQDKSVYLLVSLRSVMKPGVLSEKTVEMNAGTMKKLKKVCAVVAGALAEHQNKLYFDRHDPDFCAKIAMECFDKTMADIQERRSKMH